MPMPDATQTAPLPEQPPPPDNLHSPGNVHSLHSNGLWAQAEAYPSTASRRLPSSLKYINVDTVSIKLWLNYPSVSTKMVQMLW